MLCPDLDYIFDRFHGSIFQKVHPFCLSIADLSQIQNASGTFSDQTLNPVSQVSRQQHGRQRKVKNKPMWQTSAVYAQSSTGIIATLWS